jgi:hypothetical protein
VKRRAITTAIAGALAVCAGLTAATAAGQPRAVEVSRKVGLFDVSHTWEAEVGNYNRDRWKDVLIVPHYEGPARLYRNDGGKFTQVDTGPDTFGKKDRHDCTWGDVNRDRRRDIFCTVGGGRGVGLKSKELYIQQRDGTFEDRAAQYGVEDNRGRGRDTTFVDANGDKFPDLYIGNKFPRGDAKRSTNKLFINEGGDHFRPGRDFGINRQVGGRSVQAVDYNRDGREDLLVCGEKHIFLYRNVRNNRFDNVSGSAGVSTPCEYAVMAKVNGDAKPDLVYITKRRLKVVLQKRGRFRQRPTYTRKLRGGTEVETGFVNGDNRPDLYVVQRGPTDRDFPDLMLLNKRQGDDFESIKIPQTRRGKGDHVAPIDHDRNGRTDFIVMNGFHKARGPIRLVAFK